jgi:hypothetical protein
MNDALTFIGVWYIIGLSVVTYMLLNGAIVVTSNGRVAGGVTGFFMQLAAAAIMATVWPYTLFKIVLARMPR